MKRLHAQTFGGFTLLEALLAAVVLAMAVAAITVPFTAGARNEQADARRTLAVAFAQEIMEEILAQPFEDDDPQFARNLGPELGETDRCFFDNIDDYHGYEESAGGIADIAGWFVNDPAAVGLSRRVTAQYVYVSGQDLSNPADFIRLTVEINYRQNPIVRLTRLVYAVPGA